MKRFVKSVVIQKNETIISTFSDLFNTVQEDAFSMVEIKINKDKNIFLD